MLNTIKSAHLNFKYGFEFKGHATEYFRIWIVNVVLSVMTLGIYSAWAKVRTKRYFYGNTFLDGSSFEYHGEPLKILIGRLILFFFFITYALLSYFAEMFPGIITYIIPGAFFAVVFPWLFVRAMIFNLRNSSYRGVHFNYLKNYGDSYTTFWLYGFITIATLWLGYPLMEYKRNQMMVNNSSFGQQKMSFSAQATSYFAIWGLARWLLYCICCVTHSHFCVFVSFLKKLKCRLQSLIAYLWNNNKFCIQLYVLSDLGYN